ncbi:hypothetical protein PHLGIDRAFT_221808 [Phlebiopsis gigantea 11061_1 CR5-6]|uniref:Uncharacterized protein n=1 Tax=Phlebiopsis gigantea (strain 11061_1 CR5-6) TaxID=745531 RepID=A0A0C3S4F4_PHLG1|nr:hypothetical protein PHLGIDRAFT_221808 [Phlebiopsis gigantea 11061_1 CR5-6]
MMVRTTSMFSLSPPLHSHTIANGIRYVWGCITLPRTEIHIRQQVAQHPDAPARPIRILPSQALRARSRKGACRSAVRASLEGTTRSAQRAAREAALRSAATVRTLVGATAGDDAGSDRAAVPRHGARRWACPIATGSMPPRASPKGVASLASPCSGWDSEWRARSWHSARCRRRPLFSGPRMSSTAAGHRPAGRMRRRPREGVWCSLRLHMRIRLLEDVCATSDGRVKDRRVLVITQTSRGQNVLLYNTTRNQGMRETILDDGREKKTERLSTLWYKRIAKHLQGPQRRLPLPCRPPHSRPSGAAMNRSCVPFRFPCSRC